MKRLLCLILSLTLSGLLPLPGAPLVVPVASANASGLSSSRAKFSQGDIVAAHSLLKSSVSRLRGNDKVEAYKLLGICAFLMGRRSEAEDAFRNALSLNPSTQLNKKDVLDPAIHSVFEGIRKRSPSRPAPAAARAPRTPARAAAPAASSRAVSTVTVKANAPGATVFANGLFVGTAGSPIELSPGTYKLTVSAAGFNPTTKTVTVSRSQNMTLDVELVDPIELRKQQLLEARKRRLEAEAKERERRALAAAEARAREEARRRALEAELAARQRAEAEAKAREEARIKALAAQRAAEELARQQALAEQRRKEEERKRQLAAQIAARRQAEAELRELERQEAEARALARTRRVQPASRPRPSKNRLDYTSELPSGSRSLADEFKQEQTAPPPTTYPRQPAYPQQPQQVDPRQPEYSATPPSQSYAPPSQTAYTKPYPRARRRSRSSDKSTFLAFMPFGIGQFQNDDYTLGTLSALAQVGALGFGIYEYTLVEAQQRTFEEWAVANPDPSSSAESQAFIDETQAYLDQHRQLMAIGFISFGLIWLASGIEALVSINNDSSGFSSIWDRPESPKVVNSDDAARIRPFAQMDGRFGLEISKSLR